MTKTSCVIPGGYCSFVAAVFLGLSGPALAQAQGNEEYHPTRIGISAGMGVNYHNAQDIVDRVSGIAGRRVDSFKSGVEFFGSVSVPLNRDWIAKFEYVYFFSSYSISSQYFTGFNEEFSYKIHMPTIVVQYIFRETSIYNVRVGAGVGMHFGTYEQRLSTTGNYNASANGIGSLLELEGNTALGEDLFAHLGAQMRWEFVGELRDDAGRRPLTTASTTLHFFSVGARLGMSYYF